MVYYFYREKYIGLEKKYTPPKKTLFEKKDIIYVNSSIIFVNRFSRVNNKKRKHCEGKSYFYFCLEDIRINQSGYSICIIEKFTICFTINIQGN